MRRALQLLANGILRSRVGVAAVLAVIVLGIVGVARALSDRGDGGSTVNGAPSSLRVTVDATAGDDGIASPEPPPSPRLRPGSPAPQAVARTFATAWVKHRGVSAEGWHSALLPYSTDNLAQKLSGVDPVVVPADRLTGEPVVIPYAASIVDVAIPVDSGTLRLRLVAPDGRWLVDGVDWQRA